MNRRIRKKKDKKITEAINGLISIAEWQERQQCGNRVKIQQDLGRNKVDIQEGVIQQAYPSVFTVLIDDEFEQNPPQLLSFTYTDVITKDIRMQLC